MASRLFGGRKLGDRKNVYDENAWDQVEWDETQLEMARCIVKEQHAQTQDPIKRLQYEVKAVHYWNQFYQQHQNRFFKDRHWLWLEFPQILTCSHILEVGCGVGNTLSPLLLQNSSEDLHLFGCDFSKTAIEHILKSDWYHRDSRCHVFIHDISEEDSLPEMIQPDSLDCILLIFVLSAIQPDRMEKVLQTCFRYLKPGGWLFFRDYGRYDLAQLRFKKGAVLDTNFYVRGDGTRVYFFTQEELTEKAFKVGFEVHQNQYDRRLLVNRLRQLQMYRVWLQVKLHKPLHHSSNQEVILLHLPPS
jgi:tRNAThr (cytosine32-N3)-methyltransferase